MKYITLTGDSKGEIYKELKKYGEQAYIIKIFSEEIEEKPSGLFKKAKIKQIWKAYCGVIENAQDLEKAKKIEEKKSALLKQKDITVNNPLKLQQIALPANNENIEKISTEMEELKSMVAKIIENQVDEEVVEEKIEIIQEIRNYLWQNDFSLGFSEEFLKGLKVPVYNLETFKVILKEKIRLSLNFTQGFAELASRFICLYGFPGAGKTTALVNLASHYLLNEGKKIRFFAMDTYRLGASKQIELYASVLECPCHLIQSEKDLKNALNEISDQEFIFIDTPAEGLQSENRYLELDRLLNLIPNGITRVLTLAATSKASDLVQLKEKFKKIKYDYYLITKLDETLTVGPILSLLYKDSIATAFTTAGPSVPEDLQKADAEKLLFLLK